MSAIVETAKNQITKLILEALGKAVSAGALPAEPVPGFGVEAPADPKNGEFSSNAAMVSARALGMSPRRIAEALVPRMSAQGTYIDRVEIAGPGFLNFYLAPAYYAGIVHDGLLLGADYGKSAFGGGKRVLVEFVSANPTGPMHIGNARGGAIGDGIASVLSFAGFDVTREFYINDAGNQIEKLGVSLEARYLQHFLGEDAAELPEDAYHGADIVAHAENFAKLHGDAYVNADSETRRKALVEYALPINVKTLEEDLRRYRIEYDVWFRESSLHESGEVSRVIDLLTKRGYTYESDGALWFKATEFGADKDYVLVRSNGVPTYVAPDIAYHYNKLVVRGFDRAINVLGADHHDYTSRLKAAVVAAGIDGGRLEFVLTQMVRLISGGEPVKASKRTGKSITLSTLLEEVPTDAARFYFNLREANTHFDFDLDLAVEKTAQNPVFYVQYAHARICSILRNLEEEDFDLSALEKADFTLLDTPEERALIRLIASLTEEVVAAAKNLDPSRLTKYAIDVASEFHRFYTACRVRCEDPGLTAARAALCVASRTVLRNVLGLLKITAPDRM